MYGDWFEIGHVTCRSKCYDLTLQTLLVVSAYKSHIRYPHYRISRPISQVYQSNIFSLHSNSTILALRC